MKTGSIILIAAVCFINGTLQGQSDYPFLRTADELYARGAYTEAEIAYRKALGEKAKPETAYNLGNSVYLQQRNDEAIRQYEAAIAAAHDPALKSRAWYNLGNAHYQQQAYDKSVQAFKEALKLNPADDDARNNLMLAMRQFQLQQQQQQQSEDKQQQPETENDESNQPQQQEEQKQNQPQEPQEMEPEELSREEAKEMLKAVEREDQRVQEKMKQPVNKAKPRKDW